MCQCDWVHLRAGWGAARKSGAQDARSGCGHYKRRAKRGDASGPLSIKRKRLFALYLKGGYCFGVLRVCFHPAFTQEPEGLTISCA